MRVEALKVAGAAVLLFGLAACSDRSLPSPVDEGPSLTVVGACELVPALTTQVPTYLNGSTPDALALLASSCAAGDPSQTSFFAWRLLTIIGNRFNAHGTGSPVLGSQIVNSLLACTTTLCTSVALPGINFAPALGDGGLFSVHSTDTNSAVARDPQNFLDFDGSPRTALWGIDVTAPWKVVTATDPVLVYGAPLAKGGLLLNELSIGDLLYELNVFPDLGEFVGDDLHVGVCFSDDVTLPTGPQGLEARLRREGVLLEDYVPTFCPATQTASVFAPLFSAVRSIMPASLSRRLRIDTKIRVVGGTPLDFSRFAAVGARVDGRISFLTQPISKPTAGQSIGIIKVLAVSGDGTPMEKVKIELYIEGNYGIPAGAILAGDLESLTQERLAIRGIATFPDDGTLVTILKPGGYRVCARATFADFTYSDVCADRINVKNSH